jgi:RNA polymerase sigma-70 factor, ECF subfamily
MATEQVDKIDPFEAYRPLLFSIAYRMTGSVMEAEDIVQETYLRYQSKPPSEIRSLKPFLTTITTRLCLDYLKSARTQRESYIGPWLPEPLITEDVSMKLVKRYELISTAFLVLLENLSPIERAVFLLREVFDHSYAEIAEIVDKREANCRQYYRNAKQYLGARRPRFEVSAADHEKLVRRFMEAVVHGHVAQLTNLLAEDVTLWSDGGGKVPAARRPLQGQETIMRLLLSAAGRQALADFTVTIREVNGAPALLLYAGEEVISVTNFVVHDERIHEIHIIWNPDKLQHLPPHN